MNETPTYNFADKSEWAEQLELVNEARKATPWEMADLLLWGIAAFCGKDKDLIMDLYDEMSEQLEVHRKTLQNYASVGRKFPPGTRRERLEIGHHICVVAQTPELSDYWLDAAEAGAWSVQKLRTEMMRAGRTTHFEEEVEEDPLGRSKVLHLLDRYGINASGEENALVMGFPNGEFITVSTEGKLIWQIA